MCVFNCSSAVNGTDVCLSRDNYTEEVHEHDCAKVHKVISYTEGSVRGCRHAPGPKGSVSSSATLAGIIHIYIYIYICSYSERPPSSRQALGTTPDTRTHTTPGHQHTRTPRHLASMTSFTLGGAPARRTRLSCPAAPRRRGLRLEQIRPPDAARAAISGRRQTWAS